MAIFTRKTVNIFVLIVLLQVYFSQARHAQLVYEPRAHLDSGQASVGEEAFPGYLQEEDNADKIFGRRDWPFQEDLNVVDNNNNLDSDDSSEDIVLEMPLKRVKRRLIVAGGGGRISVQARRRDMGGRSQDGVRKDNPFVTSYQTRNSSPIFRRSSPVGSAALYALFPDLAPPGYKP